jgi:hypothetical protein
MHKSTTKCNETIGKWCKNKHGASKIIDTFETYHLTSWFIWYDYHKMCGSPYRFPYPYWLLIEIMWAHFRTRRVTHITCISVRVKWIIGKRVFVWSIRWDLGHHERFSNGLENEIHIRKVLFRVSEKFQTFSVLNRDDSRVGTTWAHAAGLGGIMGVGEVIKVISCLN